MAVGLPLLPGPSSSCSGPPLAGACGVPRACVALGNVALLGALALMGAHTARGGVPPADERPDPATRPARFAIPEVARQVSIDAVTWLELDRPLEVAAAPTPAVEPAAPGTAPPPQLVMASYNEIDPARSSLVVLGRDGQQRLLGVDDAHDGWRVVEIRVTGEGDEREAIATLEGPGGSITLRLRRVSP